MTDLAMILFGEYGLDRAAQGVVGAGQTLQEASGGSLTAVVLGPCSDETTAQLAKLVDRVVVAAPPELEEYQPETALSAATHVLAPLGAGVVLLGNDIYSQEMTPRLAHRLDGSSLSDALEVHLDDGAVRASRSVYGGKATALYELKSRPAVVWLRARALPPAEERTNEGSVEEADVELATPSLRIVERRVEEQAGARLEDAEVIVSGGRGLGGPEPFEDLQKLADTIGAEMGASRAACDAGWVPPSWQVGQTGKKVAPELYLAIAISGASQHLLGMGDSKVIAAINTDAEAPIFKHCSFGIVEDYKNVVPLLTEKLDELTG